MSKWIEHFSAEGGQLPTPGDYRTQYEQVFAMKRPAVGYQTDNHMLIVTGHTYLNRDKVRLCLSANQSQNYHRFWLMGQPFRDIWGFDLTRTVGSLWPNHLEDMMEKVAEAFEQVSYTQMPLICRCRARKMRYEGREIEVPDWRFSPMSAWGIMRANKADFMPLDHMRMAIAHKSAVDLAAQNGLGE